MRRQKIGIFAIFSECHFFWRRKSLRVSKPKMKKNILVMKRLSKICVKNDKKHVFFVESVLNKSLTFRATSVMLSMMTCAPPGRKLHGRAASC